MSKFFSVRHRLFSFSTPVRSLWSMLVLLVFFLSIILLSLCLGEEFIALPQVLQVLLGKGGQAAQFVVETLRMPRVLMAAMVGAALASSGLVLQSMIRNPLASPDIIGITGGASAAAVCFLSFFATAMGIIWLPIFAISGALLAALLIYTLAWNSGVTPMRLVLVGIGISSAMGAVTTFVIAASPLSTSITAYIWLTGSVYGASWVEVKALLPWLLISWPLAFYLARRVNTQELGDQLATGLGVPVQRLRLALLFLSVIMAAPAIAYAGAVGFVGLIAPHIARRLVARSFALLLPTSALVGACLVMLADLCGRLLFQPLDIPAGVFVSAIGAPFFIYLLYRQRF
ncbi:iron complex transport system permease protein [Marinomonas polaris DSM 16579]|uniref:Iron complex transport system permease protein n=1 Tax=Marinomonas polaris DSM 16579 TaxID=1122206 RepID=A0A1M4Y8T9_9GAMM|nr:iron ABC transporter permease [Marinomonas polaris]SHF01882.1 iron complex transport system permease protein [Marinomonas polaris DSM 16579]